MELPCPSSSSSAVLHSDVSMDLPQQRSERGTAQGSDGVSSGTSKGDPVQMTHLTPPTDKHRVGHQKNHHKSKGLYDYVRSIEIGMVPSIIDVWGYDRVQCTALTVGMAKLYELGKATYE